VVVVHPPSMAGKYPDGYRLCGSVAQVGGVPSLRNVDKAADVLAAFGLP
jgi:hypothetical protein